MGPQNSLELPANAFDSRARPLIPRIGMKTDSQHLPSFESIGEHEQLGLGVGGRPNG
jgi:hypothetical protein